MTFALTDFIDFLQIFPDLINDLILDLMPDLPPDLIPDLPPCLILDLILDLTPDFSRRERLSRDRFRPSMADRELKLTSIFYVNILSKVRLLIGVDVVENVFDLNDLSDLPKEVSREIKANQIRDIDMKFIELLDIKSPLTIDEVIIGLYRKFDIKKPRSWVTTELYRCSQKSLIQRVKGKKGLYEKVLEGVS